MFAVGDKVIVVDSEELWEHELEDLVGEIGEVVEVVADEDDPEDVEYRVLFGSDEYELFDFELEYADQQEDW